jgi:hypothetical protein
MEQVFEDFSFKARNVSSACSLVCILALRKVHDEEGKEEAIRVFISCLNLCKEENYTPKCS